MTEEQVTKSIIRWLMRNGWNIIAFDFPQSGTGRCLHPDLADSKTDGIWIPDIVTHKGLSLVFFENKDRFVYSDFEKVNKLRECSSYSNAINEITKGYNYENIYYGIGFPDSPINTVKATPNLETIDFLVTPRDKEDIVVKYDPYRIFSEDSMR